MSGVEMSRVGTKLIPALFFLAALGCETLPKTQKDFRDYSRKNKGLHVVTTDSAFADVLARVKAHVLKCSTFGRSFSRSQGYMKTQINSDTFGKWERVSGDNATLLILNDSPQIINQPKGGQIFFILDLKHKPPKTVATFYDLNASSWAMYNYTKEFTSVVKGQKATCQFDEIQK